MLFVTQVFILKETSDDSRVEVNRSKFIYMLFSFFFSRVTNDFRFFLSGGTGSSFEKFEFAW